MYMCDIGLFVSMPEDGPQYDIPQGNLFGYKAAIFENLVADFFTKMKRRLYYYRKDSHLEIDFVMRRCGGCVLVESKASTGNIGNANNIPAHPEKYRVDSAIKLGDYNVGMECAPKIIAAHCSVLIHNKKKNDRIIGVKAFDAVFHFFADADEIAGTVHGVRTLESEGIAVCRLAYGVAGRRGAVKTADAVFGKFLRKIIDGGEISYLCIGGTYCAVRNKVFKDSFAAEFLSMK